MSQLTENFETRLLRELQRLVIEQPADSPLRPARRPRGRRGLLAAAGGAAAAGAAAVGVLMGSDAGSPTAAYAVERAEDGTVTVEIRSLRDAAGLERELGEAGVRAQVDYLPPGMTCREPRFTLPRGGRGKVSAGQRIREDGTVSFTLDPGQLPANETLVITSSGAGGPADRGAAAHSVAIAVAEGDVAPCEPVKDTRPVPPPAPPGKDRGGPRLDESFGPDRGFQHRGG